MPVDMKGAIAEAAMTLLMEKNKKMNGPRIYGQYKKSPGVGAKEF